MNGKKTWFIADGYMSDTTKGEFVSHEAVCVLNLSGETAHIDLTLYFEDRPPLRGFHAICEHERTNHIRLDKQISFRYQKYTIKDRTQQVDRRGGATYKISPFKLIINDGYYYVLAWNSKWNHTITYRLDRMKGVEILNEQREGNMEFAKINMESYTQQHFGMFSGEKKTVSLRFTNNLLDTMVDRFGTGADVFYRPDGDRHFVVTTQIAISDQFYGWLCGFRKMAMIVSPPDVVTDFQSFLDDIAGKYQID